MKLRGKNEAKLIIITGYRVCNSDDGGIRTVVAQLNRYNDAEKTARFYREKYIEDLGRWIEELQELEIEILLCHDMNQDFKESKVQEFYMKLGLTNLYQHVNDLEAEELPGTFIRGHKHIDHIVGTRALVDSIVGVKLIHNEEIMPSDHCSFILQFQAKLLLGTKLSQHTGSRMIYRNVDWPKLLTRIEEKVTEMHLIDKVEDLETNEVAYNRLDKKLVKIVKEALKMERKPNDKRYTAYFTQVTYLLECKHTYLSSILRFKQTGRGNMEKIKRHRQRAKSISDYLYITVEQLKRHVKLIKKQRKKLCNG